MFQRMYSLQEIASDGYPHRAHSSPMPQNKPCKSAPPMVWRMNHAMQVPTWFRRVIRGQIQNLFPLHRFKFRCRGLLTGERGWSFFLLVLSSEIFFFAFSFMHTMKGVFRPQVS